MEDFWANQNTRLQISVSLEGVALCANSLGSEHTGLLTLKQTYSQRTELAELAGVRIAGIGFQGVVQSLFKLSLRRMPP